MAEGSLDFDLVEPELIYRGRQAPGRRRRRAERGPPAHRGVHGRRQRRRGLGLHRRRRSRRSTGSIPPPDVGRPREAPRHPPRISAWPCPKPAKVRSKDLQRVLERAKGLPGEKFIGRQVLRAHEAGRLLGRRTSATTAWPRPTTRTSPRPSAAIPTSSSTACSRPSCAREPRRDGDLEAIAAAVSERERNAAEAEQALVEWRIFRFLKDRLGDEFGGIVVDVIKAGLLVELDDYFVAGLLPFPSLGGDYEPRSQRPGGSGRRGGGRRLTWGTRVRVILVSCDPALRRMSFVPAADPEERRP